MNADLASQDSIAQFDRLHPDIRRALANGPFQIVTAAIQRVVNTHPTHEVLAMIRQAQRQAVAAKYVEQGLSPEDAVWLATRQVP